MSVLTAVAQRVISPRVSSSMARPCSQARPTRGDLLLEQFQLIIQVVHPRERSDGGQRIDGRLDDARIVCTDAANACPPPRWALAANACAMIPTQGQVSGEVQSPFARPRPTCTGTACDGLDARLDDPIIVCAAVTNACATEEMGTSPPNVLLSRPTTARSAANACAFPASPMSRRTGSSPRWPRSPAG